MAGSRNSFSKSWDDVKVLKMNSCGFHPGSFSWKPFLPSLSFFLLSHELWPYLTLERFPDDVLGEASLMTHWCSAWRCVKLNVTCAALKLKSVKLWPLRGTHTANPDRISMKRLWTRQKTVGLCGNFSLLSGSKFSLPLFPSTVDLVNVSVQLLLQLNQ